MLITRGINALFPINDINHLDIKFIIIINPKTNSIIPIYHLTELNMTTDVTTKQLTTVANLNKLLSNNGI